MRHSIGSPSSPRFRYLDFEIAAALIEAARDVANEMGRPARVPPVPLSACDEETLRSALATPRQSAGGADAYPDLPSKAAALLYALAKSQACMDGNKRLALICVLAFLRMNGTELAASNTEVADMIVGVAASSASAHDDQMRDLTHWFGLVVRRVL